VCGASKFVCVAAPSVTASDKLGQTYATIQTTLSGELAAYDALNLSIWDFAPIASLVKCPRASVLATSPVRVTRVRSALAAGHRA